MKTHSVCIKLSFKFISRHRRKSVATGGFIAVGTAILIVLNSITSGINATMVNNTTHIHSGHLIIDFKDGKEISRFINSSYIRENSTGNIDIVLRREKLTVLLESDTHSVPSIVYMVDPEKEAKTTVISKNIKKGRYLEAGSNEILIGTGIASALDLKVSDVLRILHPVSGVIGSYKVAGIFHVGINHYDYGVSYISDTKNKDLLLLDRKHELSLFLKNHLDTISEKKFMMGLVSEKGSLQSWDQLMPDLVQLIELNDAAMNVIMVLVFILVGFGISNIFILTIVDRYREFGILKALGIVPNELIAIIFLESFFICMTATAIGVIAGGTVAEIAAIRGIDFAKFTSHNQYFVLTSIVKPQLTAASLFKPVLLSTMMSTVSSYLPARQAGKRIAAEMLRFS